jgi:DNA primase large subunit
MEAIWSKMRGRSKTSYNEKLALAWFLQNLGYRDDAIVEVFKYAVDFKEGKTRYYLERSRRPDGSPRYRMFRCSTMRARGLCTGCGYDRNPVGWVYAGWAKST